MYTYRIEQAIKAATVLHKGQVRKGAVPLPYVTHLMSVAFILADYTADENVVAAGLLHDTLEDTDYTEEELAEDFSLEIAVIVVAVSEPKSELSWVESKRVYEKLVEEGGESAHLVACADKIHNMRSATEEYYQDHERFMGDFGTNLDERVLHYERLSDIFNQQLQNDITNEFNHVFDQYKNFISNVKENHPKL